MKLLILTPYVPYPINSGGNQGFFRLIDILRKYIDVSIILSVNPSDSDNVKVLQTLWNDVKFHVYRKGEYKSEVNNPSYYNFLKNLRASVDRKLKRQQASADDIVRRHSTITTSDFYMPFEEGYVNFVHDVIDAGSYDLIQVDFFEYINLVNALPADIKTVFIHHELRYVREECESNLFRKHTPMDLFLYNYTKSFEIQCLNQYDAVVTVTDVDKEKLQKELNPGIIIESSPAIIDAKQVDFSGEFKFNDRLVFLGGSDHFPNLDAIDWFLNNCWNELLEQNPMLELNVIGQWKSRISKGYKEHFKNVHFKGFVENLQNELQNSIMITPIRIGSGVRMKILEAMNYGSPLVTTSVGCEGIGLDNDKDCFIADDSKSFIDAILKLSRNNILCNEFRRSAKQKFDVRPDSAQLAEIRLNIYKKILSDSIK